MSNRLLTVFAYIFMLWGLNASKVFAQVTLDESKQVPPENAMSLDMRILPILTLSEHDGKSAEQKLNALQQAEHHFNVAEQYVILHIQANIAFDSANYQQSVEFLERAQLLEDSLATKQLNSPAFAKSYQLLANNYQQLGQFEQAYDAKKTYIQRYFRYLRHQKELRVKRLSQKYQMQKRREENQLLEQKNQLKQFALQKADAEKQAQYRNILLVVAVVILFLLLLIRQLTIWRTVKRHSRKDALTGLSNRRSYFYLGNKRFSEMQQDNKSLSVLMFTIDNFNHIDCTETNNQELIKFVAQQGNETMRSRDILARIDESEFAAILPEASLEEARAIAERIREKVQQKTQQQFQLSKDITVSIGIANRSHVDSGFDQLVDAAGIAMHQASLNGQNCICNYPIKDNC